MDSDFSVQDVRQYEQDELQRGGSVQVMTVVRYHLGTHGPFTAKKKKGEPYTVIEEQIRAQRRELEQLSRI